MLDDTRRVEADDPIREVRFLSPQHDQIRAACLGRLKNLLISRPDLDDALHGPEGGQGGVGELMQGGLRGFGCLR